jgi:anaerobic magnesium-protoporphyrin IX monomethyl ester cyclase
MPEPGDGGMTLASGRRRVVLYNPRAVFGTMPLALVAVAGALDRRRFDVVIVDGRLEADPIRAVLEQIDETSVCLGVTVLTGAPIRDALAVTRAAQQRVPRLPIAWGGWHPSLFPEQCLRDARIQAVVIGQGEATFAEIVDRWAAGGDLGGVAGCAHGGAAGIVVEAPRPLIDVNDLPAHDYALLDLDRYFRLKARRQLDYVSSQGCRFRCEFCADPFVYKRGWFGLTPARTGDELAALWRRHPFDDLNFQDETFFTDGRRAAAIAGEILSRGLRLTWAATMRADQGVRLDEATLALCKRSGLRRAMVGVESGSQTLLNWMKKDVTLDQVFATAERLRAHDIGGLFPFIVGFPDEPPESVTETMTVIKRLRAMSPTFEAVVYFYQPYPGSRIADLAWQRGYPRPESLEEWAAFDYVGARGPWVSPEKWRLIQRFKFYQQHAFGAHRHWLHVPLAWSARRRVAADRYEWPVEQVVMNLVRPQPSLS